MSASLSRASQRLAAVGLLIAAIAAAFALLVAPLEGRFSSLRADLATQRELVGRLEAFAATRDSADAAAGEAQAALRSPLFLAGDTDALRSANLQALITDLAEKSGVRLSSTRGLPVQIQEGLRMFGIQAEFETGLKQLQAVLAACDAKRPALFIRSVQVSPLASRRRDSDELKVRLGIFAAVADAFEAKP
jgi:hypothetical protein